MITQNNQQDEISLKQIISVLADQKPFLILFCLSAIATAIALTYVASEKYAATTTISYRPQELTLLKMHDTQVFGAPSPVPPFEVINQNLQELVRSETILRSVVLELNLHEEIPLPEGLPWYERWYHEAKNFLKSSVSNLWIIMKYGKIIEGDPVVESTKALRHNISLIDKGSYIFYLVVRDKYPKRAPLIVDAIARHLVELLSEKQRKPGSQKKQQLKQLIAEKEADIDAYQDQIENILSSNGMVSFSLESEKTMDRISELKLKRVRLVGEIESLTARLDNVSRIYATKHTKTQRTTQGEDTNFVQPEDYKKLASEKLFTSIKLKSLKAEYATLQAAITALNSRQEKLPEIQQRLDFLQTRLSAAKRDYSLISDAHQEAEVQATAAASEAEVLHKANIPSEPVAPIKVYNAGLAALLSLFISIALVYVLDYANIRLLFTPKRSAAPRVKDERSSTQSPGGERRAGGKRRATTLLWDGQERRSGVDRRQKA